MLAKLPHSKHQLQPLPFAIHDLQVPSSRPAHQHGKEGTELFFPPLREENLHFGIKHLRLIQPMPARAAGLTKRRHDERGDVFTNQFGTHRQFGRQDVLGSIQSSVSTWRRTISSYISKDQALFVPSPSCRHVIMDVCLSPAPDAGLPDVEPTAMLQRACKP